MAREYAPIRLSIWGDDDFRDLTPRAQHLYFVLLTSPNLNYAGVADWRPGRIAANANGWTAAGVRRAADELVRGLFIVVDDESEEVLIRSFIKHDGLLKNPNVAVSMSLAFAAIASKTLRGVIVHELRRLRENQPELKGWSKVADLLDRHAIDPASYPLGYPSDEGVAPPPPQGVGYPLPKGVDQGVGYPLDQGVDQPVDDPENEGVDQGVGSLPAPAPAPSSSSIRGGDATGERHLASNTERDDPPPRTCPEPNRHCPIHPSDIDTPCRDCRTAREHHDRWRRDRKAAVEERRRADAAAQSATARSAAEIRAADMRDCPLGCGTEDVPGYIDGRLCDHDPASTERRTRHLAQIRAELAAKKAARTPEPADTEEAAHA